MDFLKYILCIVVQTSVDKRRFHLESFLYPLWFQTSQSQHCYLWNLILKDYLMQLCEHINGTHQYSLLPPSAQIATNEDRKIQSLLHNKGIKQKFERN